MEDIYQETINFTDLFLSNLLNRYFIALSQQIDKQATWFHPKHTKAWIGQKEILDNLSQNNTYSYQIIYKNFQSVIVSQNIFMVFGDLKVEKLKETCTVLKMNLQISMLCKKEEGHIYVIHNHICDNYSELSHNNYLQQTLELQKIYTQIDPHIMSFEFLFDTNQFIHETEITRCFGLPKVLEKANIVTSWGPILCEESKEKFYRIVDQILKFEKNIKTILKIKNLEKEERICELYATTIFDNDMKAVHAIFMLKDISQQSELDREKLYRSAMSIENMIACEANITNDEILYLRESWINSMNLPPIASYTEFFDMVINLNTAPLYHDLVKSFTSINNLREAYKLGLTHSNIQYKQITKNKKETWVQNTVLLIMDPITNSLCARFHIQNIDSIKIKEEKAIQDQQFYKAILSKSHPAFEISLTRDEIIKGYNSWGKIITPTSKYSEWIEKFENQCVYSEDITHFKTCFQLESLIEAYKNNKHKIYCEYRRNDVNGSLVWEAATLDLIFDNESNEMKGYGFIEDINDDKIKELDLVYKAEHDALTGLYNKYATEQKIKEVLSDKEGFSQKHAFLIMDIDHFKLINDHFGHVFGDAILSQVARKIKSLFRTDDIIGRIGGDEFVVFMKNYTEENISGIKAKEICTVLQTSLTQKGFNHRVTVSIGIAHYPNDGLSYKDLYDHSDTALYSAKESGRNLFVKYAPKMNYATSVTNNIDSYDFTETKSFEKNIAEYVFRILYESPDKFVSINSVLELIGKEYNVSRAYIFEETSDGLAISNTFEWCNEGIEPEIDNLRYVLYSDLDNYPDNFNEQGVYYFPDIDVAHPSDRKILEPQNIKSMLQFKIVRNNRFAGLIGFDQCFIARFPVKKEISEMRNIANILGIFLMDTRNNIDLLTSKNTILSIVNGLDTYSYVIDPNTYVLLFINNKTIELTQNTEIGIPCHKAFWNTDTPCARCPLRGLKKTSDEKNNIELYNPNFNVWVSATASWITWTNGSKACLIESLDVTHYKQ